MQLLQDVILPALGNTNVRAGLATIRYCEGTAAEGGYFALFGWHPERNPGRVFTSTADHPRDRTYEKFDGQFIRNGKIDFTTAAGAYQITATNFDAGRKLGLVQGFTPEEQDILATWLIARDSALDDLLAGRFEAFVHKCRGTWASLPGSEWGQPTRAMRDAQAAYEAAGGLYGPETPKDTTPEPIVAPEPAAEAVGTVSTVGEEPVMSSIGDFASPIATALAGPVGGLVVGLADTLIQGFAPLAQEKLTKEIGRHTDNPQVAAQVASVVVDAAKKVTGKADAIAAVAAAQADPAVMAQVEAQAVANLNALAPLLDKIVETAQKEWSAEEASRSAAAERGRADPQDLAPMLASWAVRGVYGLLILLFALVVVSMILSSDHKPIGELVTAFTGLVMLVASKLNTVYDYRFGSSRSSGAKDIVIQQLSQPNRR